MGRPRHARRLPAPRVQNARGLISTASATEHGATSTALRIVAASVLLPYVHLAYRIRGWGRLPFRRGATLVIANHQHDLDSMGIMARLTMDGPWRVPIRTVSSRRMFEPGFFAVRTPWIAPLVRRYDPAPLFTALGPMPIENDVRRRSLRSVARIVRARHGNEPAAAVVSADVLAQRCIPADATLDELATRWFVQSEGIIDFRRLHEPYRAEVMDETRRSVRCDLERIETALRAGATLFLTPEGHHTTDGRLLRFRDAFDRLAPLATIWLAAISYDALRGRRLSQLYRIVRPERRSDIVSSLKAARPVTVTQVVASWLYGREDAPFSEGRVAEAVGTSLRALPRRLFVDPELARHPTLVTTDCLRTCVRLGILRRRGESFRLAENRKHPRFPNVEDIVAYHARFFAETLEGAAALDH